MSELGERVDAANREATRRMLAARPAWVGVVRARHAIRGFGEREILLGGPPTTWAETSPAQRGAVAEAIEFEGWARSTSEALALADAGGIVLGALHEEEGVVPSGFAVSPSTPVLSLEDRTTARRTWAAIDAAVAVGPARSLETVAARLERRVFIRDVLGPALDRAVDAGGAIDLVSLVARALHAGDELAVRFEALHGLLTGELSRRLVRAGLPRSELGLALDHLAEGFGLVAALASGAARSIAASASGVPLSTVVTAMAQSGRRFGVRVAALGPRWCTVDLGPEALLLDDLGDRPAAECVGLGAFALPAAPAILASLHASREEVVQRVLALRSITTASHPVWTVPLLGFDGVRVGIDVRRVVETGLEPILSSLDPAAAWPRTAPSSVFVAALEAFAADAGLLEGAERSP